MIRSVTCNTGLQQWQPDEPCMLPRRGFTEKTVRKEKPALSGPEWIGSGSFYPIVYPEISKRDGAAASSKLWIVQKVSPSEGITAGAPSGIRV